MSRSLRCSKLSEPKVSRLARSFAFPSLDLELDATLTLVGHMRRDYSSTIFEYEIVHRD